MIGFVVIHNKLDVSFNHLLAVITNFGVLFTIAWFTHQFPSHLMKLLPSQRTAAFTANEAIAVIALAFVVNRSGLYDVSTSIAGLRKSDNENY
jgi:hypothetical protein